MTHRRVLVLLALLVVVTLWTPARAQGQAQETPRSGGVLKVAMIGEPPSLDLHWTTAVITQEITFHVYEGLFTYDRNYAPIPMLAESYTMTPDGRRYNYAALRDWSRVVLPARVGLFQILPKPAPENQFVHLLSCLR